jgi:thiamine-monophosphate kinase
VRRYRAPRPRLEAGQKLAPMVTAMMDVSDGLLIDASRIAAASGVAVAITLDAVALSEALVACLGDSRETRLGAATAGDDYELLFTAAPARAAGILELSGRLGLRLTRIGTVESGSGLRLTDGGEPIDLPLRLGWEHR